jgi:hypothetical protein
MYASTPHRPLLSPNTIVCFDIIYFHPLLDDELGLYAIIQVMTYLRLHAFSVHAWYCMRHRDLRIKSVGYFITKAWFKQIADHRGVVMMHSLSVCEYGHW